MQTFRLNEKRQVSLGSRSRIRGRQRKSIAAIATLSAIVLSGCSAKTQDSASAEAADPTGSKQVTNCADEKSDAKLREGVSRAMADYPSQFGWKYNGQNNFDVCKDLTYALLEQGDQGNSQFATLMVLFHKGQYIGVDSDRPQQVQRIEATVEGLRVTYRDWERASAEGASNAEISKYTTTAVLIWDGKKVRVEGHIPNSNL